MSDDDRAAFEAEELRGLAQRYGATRRYTADGIGYWSFPRWVCPVCGPDTAPLPECPNPLASHGAP